MARHTVSFTLDPRSIDNAINEIRKYRDDFVNAVRELVRSLTEDGREAAVMNVLRLGAFDTGELADSFRTRGYYNPDTSVGIIYTDCWYAIFVEYGTGVVGAGASHPGSWVPPPVYYKDRVYTQYDTYGHGDNGWWYVSDHDGQRHWTKGQPSSPFMYHTFVALMNMAENRFKAMRI